MKYVGLQSQIRRNNYKSIALLIAFPLLLLGLVWLFFFISISYVAEEGTAVPISAINTTFLTTIPLVLIGVAAWFLIAWFSHSSMIQKATGAKSLARKEDKRVYNLVENLCISQGMKMPQIFLIEDDSLNAYASGLSDKTFACKSER